MRSNIPAGFTDASLMTNPTAKVTIERWLPEWTPLVTSTKQYYYGHAAAINGNIVLRARYKEDGTGVEYQFVDLSAPNWNTWEGSIAPACKPMWSTGSNGAMLDIVATAGGFRLFYFSSNTEIKYMDFSTTAIDTGGSVYTSADPYSPQLSAVDENTLYIAMNAITNDGPATKLISDRVRTVIYKAKYSGSWTVTDTSGSYPAYNIEGGMYRDDFVVKKMGASFTNVDLTNTAADEIIARWAFRPNGGLKVVSTGANDVTAIYAGTFWYKYKFKSHSHGLHLFAEHDKMWRKLRDIGTADYDDDMKLFIDSHVSGTGNIVTWLSLTEPGYFNQYVADVNAPTPIPRVKEVVAAKLNDSGDYLSEPIRLGGTEFTGARLIEASDGTLYCIGYEAVQSSPPASVFSTVNNDALHEIAHFCTKTL